MVVEQYMTPNPITVRSDTTLRKAQDLFQNHQIRHLPVVQGKRLVGIITDRDLRQLLPSSLAAPDDVARFRTAWVQVKVGDVMTRRVLSVTPDTRTHRAARLMVEHRIGCLPVVRGSSLVGIITTIDLLRAMAGEEKTKAASLGETRSRQRKPLEDRRTPRAEVTQRRR
ncbi:MAG: CBS domain-containing protein [Candidatus Methylomirabilales bacterium]